MDLRDTIINFFGVLMPFEVANLLVMVLGLIAGGCFIALLFNVFSSESRENKDCIKTRIIIIVMLMFFTTLFLVSLNKSSEIKLKIRSELIK